MKLLAFSLFLSIVFAIEKDCDPTQCPHYKYSAHYRDLKCEPVFDTENKCCPTHYTCLNLERMQTEPEKCYFKNRSFNIHEDIPSDELEAKCSTVMCFCSEGYPSKLPSAFRCAHNDCPEFFRPYNPDCKTQYSLNRCCSVGRLCGDSIKNAKRCTVGNETYFEGQKIHTQSNICDRCICNNKGEVECVEVECDLELHNADELRKYCAPAYDDRYCCPDRFICPDNTTTVINPIKSDEHPLPGNTCKFGQQTLSIGSTVELSNPEESCTVCSCILPPLVTCYSKPECTT